MTNDMMVLRQGGADGSGACTPRPALNLLSEPVPVSDYCRYTSPPSPIIIVMKKIIIALLVLLPMTSFAWFDYSDGVRTGTLIKCSHRGLFFKTWECTMNLGGLKSELNGKSSSMVPNTWDFSIDPETKHGENIAELLGVLTQKQGQDISVTYQQEFITAPWRSDTSYFVTHVE